ncbi:hypothetical protein COW53_09205 [bacterium CG17_big_fil_post_rev_8_21_14_2_50_64_8]|nr:MAG: hypothetical protein COW53_09205 [bacterium CG17_big_fil_post_rev_8_21_14_2_50_64_8]PJA76027.1 MAG: hypothetical protein CO151_04175 [bacterium CG_4_9_14_3_um_filter_65_15]
MPTDIETLETKRMVERLQRVESDLREGEAFQQAIFNAAHTGLIIVDFQHQQIMDANTTAAAVLGYDPDDLIGRLLGPITPTDCDGIRQKMLEDGEVRDVETTLTHQDGHAIPVILSLTRVERGQGHFAVMSFLDISLRKAAEKELRQSHERLAKANEELKKHKDQIVQSEKLASIGQLAAGVAHEINNPVGFVTSNLGTLTEYMETIGKVLELYTELGQLPPEDDTGRAELVTRITEIKEEEDLDFILDDVANVLKESQDGVKRVTEIVQNLKSFAREDSQERRPHNINDGIEAMIKMVWNELKYHCEVERDFGEVPVIRCHPGQINQVIMNMLVNASHAMPEEGGSITVSTRTRGEEIEISIADTGTGISPDIRNRIFDPFFTTKDVGKGTGLGLAISHGIIEDHGGRIELESELGQGSTFHIYLPLTGTGDDDDPEQADLIG